MSLHEDPRVKAFLEMTCKRVPGKEARAQIREELLDHLQQALQEGRSLDEAIRELGNPKELGVSLARVHRPFYLALPFFGALGSLLLIIGVLWISDLVQKRSANLSSRITTIINANRARFEEDQEILSKEAFFSFPGKESDAGPYLNPKITWVGNFRKPYEFLGGPREINIPTPLADKLYAIQATWTKHASDGLDRDLDLRWMSKLSRYDHWDLFEWAPMQAALSDMRETSWESIPLPDSITMIALAKLRLLRGLRTHQALPALAEVRQLARINYSNETLIGAMVSVALLSFERDAYDEAVLEGLIKPQQWQPFSRELTKRAHRAMFGYPEIFQMGSSSDEIEKFAGGTLAKAGYCSSLYESVGSYMILRDRLGQFRLPFETDFNPQIKKVISLVTDPSGPCRLSYWKRLNAQPQAVSEWYSGKPWISFIPWLRQWSAIGVQNPSYPDYMTGPYRNYD